MVCVHAAEKAFHEEADFKWNQKEEESGLGEGRQVWGIRGKGNQREKGGSGQTE